MIPQYATTITYICICGRPGICTQYSTRHAVVQIWIYIENECARSFSEIVSPSEGNPTEGYVS